MTASSGSSLIFAAAGSSCQSNRRSGQRHRVVIPIMRRDQNSDVYDLVSILLDELRYDPFGAHDDLIDAASRHQTVRAGDIRTRKHSICGLGAGGRKGTPRRVGDG